MMKKLLALLPLLGLLWCMPARAQENIIVPNEATTGTVIGKLAKYTGANPNTAIIATTSDTTGIQGIVTGFDLQGSIGTTGNAKIAKVGQPNCTFDSAGVTSNHYVGASTISGGSCADVGATCPSVQVVGKAMASGASGASVPVDVTQGCAGAGGSGINQLTGDVTAGPGTGSQAATLAASGVTAATYGDATHSPQCAYDAKGRATSCSNVAITASASNIAPGTTTVVGGTCPSGQNIYNNSGVVGCQAAGAGTVTSITLPPGFTTTVGTCNTSTQNITSTGTINGQLCVVTKGTGTYTVLTTDTGSLLVANAASVVFQSPNPAAGTQGTQYNFGSDGTHGYTLSTVGGTKTFYGSSDCTGATTATIGANVDTFITDDGTNYKCTEATAAAAASGTVTHNGNLTTNGIIYGGTNGTTDIKSTAAPTNGQIAIGSTGAAPVLGTITAGSNITVTNGAGSITIAASGSGGGSVTILTPTGGGPIVGNSCVFNGTQTDCEWTSLTADEIKIACSNVIGAGGGSDNGGVQLQTGGSGWHNGANDYTQEYVFNNNATVSGESLQTLQMFGEGGLGGGPGYFIDILLHNLQTASIDHGGTFQSGDMTGTGASSTSANGVGYMTASTAVATGARFFGTGTSLTSGRCVAYTLSD